MISYYKYLLAQETLLKHLYHKKITRHKTKQLYVLHDVTLPKRMDAIFETDPKIGSYPAGTNLFNRGVLQNLEHSAVGYALSLGLESPSLESKPVNHAKK